MTLHICFLIPSFADGGAQKQCILLINELVTRTNIKVSLIYFYDGVHDDLLNRDGIEIRRLRIRSNYDPRNIVWVRRILKDIRPHILMTWMHACDVYGFFLKRSVPSLLWVMTERNSFYPSDPRYVLRRVLGRYADMILANSVKGAQYWLKSRPRGRVEVLANISPIFRSPQDPPTSGSVLSIGRLEPQKNTRCLVAAFIELATRKPELSFAVIGDGAERAELEGMVARSGVGERIVFRGFRRDIAEQIAEASLVVSISHYEGLPNVIMEAVAQNRLVVVSDIDEHREFLGPDYPYYVSDRNNPFEVSRMIQVALGNVSEIHVLVSARARLLDKTAAHIADEFIAILRSQNER